MKLNKLEDLAVFGGPPKFIEKIHVGRPNIGERSRFLKRVNNILDRRWLTNNGPYVQEFEQILSEFLGVKHCVAVCNATIALEIVIRAVEMKGEVILPSFTFVATAHALMWQEITPVFCDIDPQTHNLDPDRVVEMISPRTSGIIGVHVWGRPCVIPELTEIAQKRNLRLIFDAAHAFGCSSMGKMIGNFGVAEVFSFHATKFINTFEGGVIATNQDEMAQKIRLMTNFGFAGYDKVIYLGTNGKMNEIAAAMGITGVESLDEIIQTNRNNYEIYLSNFADIPGIKMVEYNEREKNNFQYVVMEIDEAITGINRDQIVQVLHAENILARRYFYPGCHQMEPYLSYFPHAGLLLPVTNRLSQKVMSLPNGTSITQDDARKISDIILWIIKHGHDINDSLKNNL